MRHQHQHQFLGRNATQAGVPGLGLIPYDQISHLFLAETVAGVGDEGGQ